MQLSLHILLSAHVYSTEVVEDLETTAPLFFFV